MHNILNLELFCTYSKKRNWREVVREREREDSLIPLFSPLGIKIVLLFHGCIGFCFEVGILMVKHSLPCLI